MLEQDRVRPAAVRSRCEARGCCPRSALSCSRAAARSAGLENRRSPSARVWSAPSTSRPGSRSRDRSRLLARQQCRDLARIAGRARCSIARSSMSAGSTSTGNPASRRMACRTALFDASTSGRSASHSGIDHATLCDRMTAALGEQAQAPPPRSPRSSAASRRCSASCAARRACARTRPPRPPPCGRYIGRRRDAP